MSSPLLARQGRHQQRYDNQLRLVAGYLALLSFPFLIRVPFDLTRCIPYKLNTDGDNQSCDLLDRVEVLMVTSPGRLDLVFPKDTALGVWEFRSKSRQKACSLEGTCKGYMFALEVTEELDCYPEKDSRDRKWVSV
ncbi:hypothetical protein B296_00035075 [Ensete ventricosum]|uniref:Uncharacterized protein n=1 Tax=Ensete ventricosum TaxID=4639 RepID=A0A426YYZ9_ENSVE|nr:hypothetical protein B296_00035075 [Ensete ventricosum]